MTRAIFSIAALLGAAIALAGCGGGGSGTVSTSGVAGASTAKGTASFHAQVQGFEAKIQSSVKAFENGNVSKASGAAGLLANCNNIVNTKFAPKATTSVQKQAVVHLRIVCRDLAKTSTAFANGNVTKAKAYARQALTEAKNAVQLTG